MIAQGYLDPCRPLDEPWSPDDAARADGLLRAAGRVTRPEATVDPADPTRPSAAVVQQIQLELFRRRAASAEDGEAVVIGVLRGHTNLRTRDAIDRNPVGVPGDGLGSMAMVPLRDVGTSVWNAHPMYFPWPTRRNGGWR